MVKELTGESSRIMKEYGYEIIIWWSAEDGCFLAEVPELPGCVADGETVQEAAKAAEESIRVWIDVNRERGFAIPEPKGRLAYA